MNFNIGYPDTPAGVQYQTATLRLAATNLSTGRHQGLIDLDAVPLNREDGIVCEFSQVLGVWLEPVAGLLCCLVDASEQPAARADVVDGDDLTLAADDTVRRLRLIVENTSGARLSFNALLTVHGIQARPVPDGYARPALPAFTSDATIVQVFDRDDTPVAARWDTLPCCDAYHVASLAAHTINIPTAGVSYRIGVDFSGAGTFDNLLYDTCLQADDARLIIAEQQNNKTTGHAYWTIYVPSDVPTGAYGLTAELRGYLGASAWPGGPGPVAGVWDALTAIS